MMSKEELRNCFADTTDGYREFRRACDDMHRVMNYLNNFIPAYIVRRQPFKLLGSSQILGALVFRFAPIGSDDWGVTCEPFSGNPARFATF